MGFLQGTELYSTAVTPDKPDLQFDAQINATLQAKYDAGYNRASELYGSILNPSVTREDSKAAKEEYLKTVEASLKRAGKIDYSIDQNVASVENLFKGIYSNKMLLKDVVWTKNYEDELQRAEMFKESKDSEKAGGSYWDEGVKYLQYKRKEFQEAGVDQMMNFEDVKFVPYNSVMNDAIATMKKANLSMEYDKISGGYKITTKNGEQLRSPLTALFEQTLGRDPKFIEMFKVKSYVDRKDWVYSKLANKEYSNESEAQLNYMNAKAQRNLQQVDNTLSELDIDRTILNQRIEYLKSEYKKNSFQEGSDLYNELVGLSNLKQNADMATEYITKLHGISSSGNLGSLNVALDDFDNQNAYSYFNDEISKSVNVLINQDSKVTKTADEFALKTFQSNLNLREMAQQHSYNVVEENTKQANRIALAAVKSTGADDDASTDAKINDAVTEVANYSVNNSGYSKYLKLKPNASESEFGEALNDPENVNHSLAKKVYKDAQDSKIKLKRDANLLSLKAGRSVSFPEVVKLNELVSNDFIAINGGDLNVFLESTFKDLSQKYNIPYTEELRKKIAEKAQSGKYDNLSLSELFNISK